MRCHLHFLTGRAEEKLTFDVQPELAAAARLSPTAPACSAVERFMKRYFLVAKDVGDLTRIFCAALEVDHAKPLDMVGRVLGLVPARQGRDQGRDRFRRRQRPAQHRRRPRSSRAIRVNLISASIVAGRHDLLFHPDAIKADHAARCG